MTSKIRVLVVDDSVVIRKILTDVLSEDESIEVVGAAANGKIALQKIPQVNPTIITLDIEMPEMDGLETIVKIRESYPLLPIIMFSTLTARGATDTLEALSRGANDYVTKPANVGSVSVAKERVKAELISKIKALAGRRMNVATAIKKIPVPEMPSAQRTSKKAEIVAIGTSTGGPNALSTLFDRFPAPFPVPIVITQHMPPLFTKMLAERISSKGILQTFEAEEGMPIVPGKAYIAPGDYHLEVVERHGSLVCHLTQAPPENSCRPAVDVMLRSVCRLFGERTLAVILTGMGYDGMLGCEQVKVAGGQVLAQDEATSVVWGMPGAVAEKGFADAILPLSQIQNAICQRVIAKNDWQTSLFYRGL